MMTFTIEELRRLEAEATPGPWDVSGLTVYDTCMDSVASTHSAADAALIVAMRNVLPELLKALEEAQELLRRVPSALNGAFMAGTEEREGGSARRQDKYAKEGDDLRREIPEFLRTLPPHGGVDV